LRQLRKGLRWPTLDIRQKLRAEFYLSPCLQGPTDLNE
jgi:hypothetical protein